MISLLSASSTQWPEPSAALAGKARILLARATLLCLALAADPAHGDVLVSNIDQTSSFTLANLQTDDQAQGFTTGSNSTGYDLTSIQVRFFRGASRDASIGTVTVTLNISAGPSPGRPGAVLHILSGGARPHGGVNTYTAPSGATLAANTQYFVTLEGGDGGPSVTLSNGEDSTSQSGWSVSNVSRFRNDEISGFISNWDLISTSRMIRVNGRARAGGATAPGAPTNLRATPGNRQVRLHWTAPTEIGGGPITHYQYRYAAVGEDFGAWENVAAGSQGVTVGNLVNGREYVFEVRAVNALGKGGAEAARATPERRIAPPPPPRGGGGGGGGLLFVPEAPLGLMAMPGEGAVRLEWGPPESDGGTPILRYEYRLKEGRGEFGEWSPIEDSTPGEVNATGYTVGELGNGTVYVFELRAVNLVGNGPESEAVEAVMGLDPAYWSNFGAEDLQGVEASLERGPFGGGPQSLRLRFGADLRFEESELDGDGEVRGTRSGSYGYRYTSRTTGELRLDYDGGEACELRLTFSGVGAGSYSYRCGGVLGGQGSFRMSGLNRAPEITGAGAYEVAENTARVGQLEAVDQDKQDEITEYGIAGGADGALFAVEAETGELMFREAPDYETPGDVASDDPQSGAADNEYIVVVEVRSGEGEKERKGSRAIRVRVSDEEEPPEITNVGPFEVVENRTRVGQLEAVDQDKQDEITEYGIAGGADGGLFAVVAETGELLFREAPDYEAPSDVESAEPASGAADNEYILVVEVRSGEGERERKGSRAIRVRVSDEEEPPGAPGAPVVTAEGSDSLKVSWREPENRGPEITDYEVRYREGGEAGYSDGGHEGRGLEVRLSGLEEGTVYEVQVRAVNEEGISEWSEPGGGRTDMEEPDPEDPSDFTGEDLKGRRLTLRLEGEEGTAGSLELRFGEGNRFEQIESVGEQAATRAEAAASRSGSYTL